MPSCLAGKPAYGPQLVAAADAQRIQAAPALAVSLGKRMVPLKRVLDSWV
jgi:hypothetical protein